MTTITGDAIQQFQIRTQIRAVRLEKLGMKHSRGNITPKLKKHYGMKRSATHDEVIQRLEQELQ